ncbi:DUF7114 family protein [Natrarchaeobaculum aegyptiacum]|uniref:Polyprenyl synthetase n=1 Tax=Natrarchaeobaculum aegyptiacum TaxID=745377 RepID=A0A2Z2HRV0_9EURY|nr:hypothetical protein [Natrarchaeobaculum aegyptiacum]ARS89513.1 hypothetical protein B1756_06980 [Natrarchaeobaculum aegyptiacum]
METADNCRRAAFEAVADVEPPRLHDLVETILEDASMVPGALTIESAACATSETGSVREEARENGDRNQENVDTHAAGVQLIYEGLRLTRTLAHEEPWSTGEETARTSEADLEILAADILVARGFYLLARTEAADKAVQTVRAFGRDQTHRVRDHPTVGSEDTAGDSRETDGVDASTLDGEANLERDVLELAVRTGAAAVGEHPSPRLLALADDLARSVGPSFPPTEECLSDGDLEARPSDATLDDGTTDRATSATDH